MYSQWDMIQEGFMSHLKNMVASSGRVAGRGIKGAAKFTAGDAYSTIATAATNIKDSILEMEPATKRKLKRTLEDAGMVAIGKPTGSINKGSIEVANIASYQDGKPVPGDPLDQPVSFKWNNKTKEFTIAGGQGVIPTKQPTAPPVAPGLGTPGSVPAAAPGPPPAAATRIK